MDYGIRTKINLPFNEAIDRVKEELSKEGFGVLTEINVKDTLKKKINVEFRNYLILGACNPNFAYKALQEETELGLLLPCNVIVYEKDNEVIVSAINLQTGMSFIETLKTDKVSKGLGIISKKNSLNKNLEKISGEVKDKLQRVISNLN